MFKVGVGHRFTHTPPVAAIRNFFIEPGTHFLIFLCWLVTQDLRNRASFLMLQSIFFRVFLYFLCFLSPATPTHSPEFQTLIQGGLIGSTFFHELGLERSVLNFEGCSGNVFARRIAWRQPKIEKNPENSKKAKKAFQIFPVIPRCIRVRVLALPVRGAHFLLPCYLLLRPGV